MPTIVFILAVYGLYVLMAAWCRRKHFGVRGRVPKARPRWLALTYGAIGLSVFLALLVWLRPASQDQKVRLAGILGMTEGMVWPTGKAGDGLENLPVKPQSPNAQPAYALLHPESQPSLLPPGKTSAGSAPLRKPKTGRTAATPEGKKLKTASKLAKKEKLPVKTKVKKKKGPGTPAKSDLSPPEHKG